MARIELGIDEEMVPYFRRCRKMRYDCAMNRFASLGVFCLSFLMLPKFVLAIPPPDIIANVGSQLTQIFSLLAVGGSIGFGVFLQYLSRLKARSRREILWMSVGAMSLLALVLVVAYFVVDYQNRIARTAYEESVSALLHQRVIEQESLAPSSPIPVKSTFFDANVNLPLSVTNEEFDALRKNDVYVLDAREDEEYAIGNYPGSHHIRFADLLAASWMALPTDQVVYVLCWSGIRGSEVTSFLRDHGVVAQFLKDGADGWVKYGGTWNGGILFSSTYGDERYTKLFETSEVHSLAEEGVVLIDVRGEASQKKAPIVDAIPASIIYTPSSLIDAMLAKVSVGSRVIAICDEYVNCFDAKLVGVRLEKLGHVFLGRYAKPWEY